MSKISALWLALGAFNLGMAVFAPGPWLPLVAGISLVAIAVSIAIIEGRAKR